MINDLEKDWPVLLNKEDFLGLKKYLLFALNDIKWINNSPKYCALDYYILMQFNNTLAVNYNNIIIKYVLHRLMDNDIKFIFLPRYYEEFEYNVKTIKRLLSQIKYDDIYTLNNNQLFIDFIKSFSSFIDERSNNDKRNEVIITLQKFNSFSSNDIKDKFQRILKYFFYQEFYVNTYENMILFLQNDKMINLDIFMENNNLKKLPFDINNYITVFLRLSRSRSRSALNAYFPNQTDTWSFIQTCELSKKNINILFYTSEVPFSVFTNDELIKTNNIKPISRNTLTLAFCMYVLEKEGGIENAKNRIKNQITEIDYLLQSKDIFKDNVYEIYYSLNKYYRNEFGSHIVKFAQEHQYQWATSITSDKIYFSEMDIDYNDEVFINLLLSWIEDINEKIYITPRAFRKTHRNIDIVFTEILAKLSDLFLNVGSIKESFQQDKETLDKLIYTLHDLPQERNQFINKMLKYLLSTDGDNWNFVCLEEFIRDLKRDASIDERIIKMLKNYLKLAEKNNKMIFHRYLYKILFNLDISK